MEDLKIISVSDIAASVEGRAAQYEEERDYYAAKGDVENADRYGIAAHHMRSAVDHLARAVVALTEGSTK